jgi:hypothetical protein
VSSVDLAAAAAFTAAALSLVNVVITARLARRENREQWRREQERPIVARILTISSDMISNWSKLVAAEERSAGALNDELRATENESARQHLVTGTELSEKLRFEAAQLDLLAGPQVREAAHHLAGFHNRIMIDITASAPGLAPLKIHAASLYALHDRLVEQARADLGLAPSYQVPPNSILGRILGRDRS